MWMNLRAFRLAALLPLVALAFLAAPARGQETPAPPAPAGTWYFAVSGDSRDCGDLVMPKIARDIEAHRAATPVAFYWHLGDFRRLYGPDCDMIKRLPAYAGWDCKARPEEQLGGTVMSQYLEAAWDDFLRHQIAPFGETPVFLGIGNHELAAGRTRDDFRRKFQPWLTSGPIHLQRVRESAAKRFYTTEGETYYHWVQGGVDFIDLDNADGASFSAAQLEWLQTVLANDAADPAVKTIVAGMHEALPYSKQRGHAMDASCQGLCSGNRAYELLFRAHALDGKQVYVFGSHSHLFVERAFDQPERAGQELPGWIVGTAGAEQYRQEADPIQYGYALVAVHADGTLGVSFREVGRDSPPLDKGVGADALTEFCFTQNKRPAGNSEYKGKCACGQALP